MHPSWRDAVLAVLGDSQPRRVAMEKITAAARRLTTGDLVAVMGQLHTDE